MDHDLLPRLQTECCNFFCPGRPNDSNECQLIQGIVDQFFTFFNGKVDNIIEYLQHNPAMACSMVLIVLPFPSEILNKSSSDRVHRYWQRVKRELYADDDADLVIKIHTSIAAFTEDYIGTFHKVVEHLVVNWVDIVPDGYIQFDELNQYHSRIAKSKISLHTGKIPMDLKQLRKEVKQVLANADLDEQNDEWNYIIAGHNTFANTMAQRIVNARDQMVALTSSHVNNNNEYNNRCYKEVWCYDEKAKQKKSYLEWTLQTQWYMNYGLNWLFQLQVFHRFRYQTVFLVTGATGVGKSTQFPKLLRHARIILQNYRWTRRNNNQYNLNRPVSNVCTVPRTLLAKKNANFIGQQIAGSMFGNEYHDPNPPNPNNSRRRFVEYRYRGKNRVNPQPDLLNSSTIYSYPLTLMTDGILQQMLMDELIRDDVGSFSLHMVMIDESHEHNKNMDCILTQMRLYLGKIRSVGHGNRYKQNHQHLFKLAIISATMEQDEQRYKDFFHHLLRNPLTQHITQQRFYCSPRIHIQNPAQARRYRRTDMYNRHPRLNMQRILKNSRRCNIPCRIGSYKFHAQGIEDWCCQAFECAYREHRNLGATLIFLPSKMFIARTIKALHARNPNHIIAIPLYAKVHERVEKSATEQKPADITLDRNKMTQAATNPSANGGSVSAGQYQYKIIVSTSVAEASLTIDDLGIVIDTGIQSGPVFNPRVTKPMNFTQRLIAQSNSQQRLGRVGRKNDGVCLTLYSREDVERSSRCIEIQNSDFSDQLYNFLKIPGLSINPVPLTLLDDYKKLLRDPYGCFYVEHPDQTSLIKRSTAHRVQNNYSLVGDRNDPGTFVKPLEYTPVIDHGFRTLQLFSLLPSNSPMAQRFDAFRMVLDFRLRMFGIVLLARMRHIGTLQSQDRDKHLEWLIGRFVYQTQIDKDRKYSNMSSWIRSDMSRPLDRFWYYRQQGAWIVWFHMYRCVLESIPRVWSIIFGKTDKTAFEQYDAIKRFRDKLEENSPLSNHLNNNANNTMDTFFQNNDIHDYPYIEILQEKQCMHPTCIRLAGIFWKRPEFNPWFQNISEHEFKRMHKRHMKYFELFCGSQGLNDKYWFHILNQHMDHRRMLASGIKLPNGGGVQTVDDFIIGLQDHPLVTRDFTINSRLEPMHVAWVHAHAISHHHQLIGNGCYTKYETIIPAPYEPDDKYPCPTEALLRIIHPEHTSGARYIDSYVADSQIDKDETTVLTPLVAIPGSVARGVLKLVNCK